MHEIIIYEAYRGIEPETNRQVLVQIFRNKDTNEIISSQMAYRAANWDTWGVPFNLELHNPQVKEVS
jgi:hypothetical protein